MSTLAELNVTPLLDLAFVLLIIFMISAPLLANRVDLIIPTTKARRDAVPMENIALIEVNRDGEVSLDSEVLASDRLGEAVMGMKSSRPELAVILKMDETLTLREIMPLLDLLKTSGVVDVSLMGKPDPD